MSNIIQFPARPKAQKPVGAFLDLGGSLPSQVIIDDRLWVYDLKYELHRPKDIIDYDRNGYDDNFNKVN